MQINHFLSLISSNSEKKISYKFLRYLKVFMILMLTAFDKHRLKINYNNEEKP